MKRFVITGFVLVVFLGVGLVLLNIFVIHSSYFGSLEKMPEKKVVYTLDHSEGSCLVNTDCTWVSQGCGGGHGTCTNNPKDHIDDVSTCDIVSDFPSNNGYSCGCIEKIGKCGWKK